MEKIEIKIGDITQEKADAIVNAANTSLVCFDRKTYDAYLNTRIYTDLYTD